MSIRIEIRATLAKRGAQSATEMLRHVPSVGRDEKRLESNLYTLKAAGKIKREGKDGQGKARFVIDHWPAERLNKTSDTAPSRKVSLCGMDAPVTPPRLFTTTKPITVAGFELIPLDDGRMFVNDRDRRTLCACLPEPVVRRIAELVGDED